LNCQITASGNGSLRVVPPIKDIKDGPAKLLDNILDINEITSGNEVTHHHPRGDKRKRWDYTVIEPDRRIIVLDTRTWRIYKGDKGPVGLLSDEAIDFQLTAHLPEEEGLPPDKYTIVVSPAPVFGYEFVEKLVQPLARFLTGGPEIPDAEAWSVHRQQFESFIKALANFKTVIILSGDVHYSFSNTTAYFQDYLPGQTPARLVQLCSSAASNEDWKTRAVTEYAKKYPSESKSWIGFRDNIDSNLRKILAKNLKRHESDLNTKDRGEAASLWSNIMFRASFQRPAVLPAFGWKNDTAYDIVKELSKESSWCYRTQPIKDPSTIIKVPEIIGYPNLGLVEFRPIKSTQESEEVTTWEVIHRIAGLNFHLSHTILKAPKPYGYNRSSFTIVNHKISLTTPTAEERPEVSQ